MVQETTRLAEINPGNKLTASKRTLKKLPGGLDVRQANIK